MSVFAFNFVDSHRVTIRCSDGTFGLCYFVCLFDSTVLSRRFFRGCNKVVSPLISVYTHEWPPADFPSSCMSTGHSVAGPVHLYPDTHVLLMGEFIVLGLSGVASIFVYRIPFVPVTADSVFLELFGVTKIGLSSQWYPTVAPPQVLQTFGVQRVFTKMFSNTYGSVFDKVCPVHFTYTVTPLGCYSGTRPFSVNRILTLEVTVISPR